ncbi:condensin subunit, partial [Bonamia ostreae]
DEPLLQEDSSVRWYNYDNPNDRRYIAEIDQDDNFAPDDSEGDFEPNNSDPLSQSQFENLLSEQSSTFNQQNRSFFQVDVQQLKSNLWRSLKAIEETKAFDENNVNEKMANSEEDSNLSDKNLDKNKNLSDQNLDKNKKLSDQNLGGKKISFKESVSLMKKRNKSMESVSVQYCFVCLLHLANENGLELKTPSLEDDFTVELQ